ncbi:hypothetical protein RR48_05551 [Papilio machaon]|uniref:Uncharacterized protein n=1 Tax=Papilio machaon TaxID=76193 RepID=A0A0N1IFP2_PAPMA|nr:hypothetical protein RR48_05551 [Papilio machaon]
MNSSDEHYFIGHAESYQLVAQHPRVDRGYECRPTISPRKGQKKIWRTDRQPSLVEEALQEEEEEESYQKGECGYKYHEPWGKARGYVGLLPVPGPEWDRKKESIPTKPLWFPLPHHAPGRGDTNVFFNTSRW